MEQEYTYYAFISYSHEDKGFARLMQKHLESFKLPSVLCKKYPHVPKHVRPIFLDWPDLKIGQQGDTLENELAASRYLIVICSENSAWPKAGRKNRVDEEVKTFIALRPENINRVIPIIYRDRGGNDVSDYLVPTVKEKEILAADILEKGREHVFSDVIAKMVGLKPDVLWDRHQRELRRKRRLRMQGCRAAAVCAAVASWWCWDYYGTHVEYYTDYIERNNIPEGLYELSKEQIAGAFRHYRFTTHKHRLRSVEYCNSAGTTQEHDYYWTKERSARMEFEYGEDGQADKCVHRNARGKKISVRKFTPGAVDFEQSVDVGGEISETGQSAAIATGVGGENNDAKSSVGRFFVSRQRGGENDGVVIRELFCKTNSLIPMKDAQDLVGREYKLDEFGRIVEVHYLTLLSPSLRNAEIERRETRNGMAGYRLTYDKKGHVVSVTYVNKAGKPILNEEKWAELRMVYDAHGNPIEEAYYGADGKPSISTLSGCARIVIKYDAAGRRISETLYDAEGNEIEE